MYKKRVEEYDWDRDDSVEKVTVRFDIVSEQPLDEIRAKIQIEPSFYCRVGDGVTRKDSVEFVGVRGRSQWTLLSRDVGITSKDANAGLRALIDALRPWQAEIAQWSEIHLVEFQVIFYSVDAMMGAGPSIPAATLRSIADFGASYECTVICRFDHQYPEEEDAETGWIDVQLD